MNLLNVSHSLLVTQTSVQSEFPEWLQTPWTFGVANTDSSLLSRIVAGDDCCVIRHPRLPGIDEKPKLEF